MQFQICNSGEVWVSVTPAEAHRIARKRTGALAAIVRQQRKDLKQESREYRRAERELQNDIREADRCNRAFWKRIRIKPELRSMTAIERKPETHKPTKTGWLAGGSLMPRYSGQIFDRMGRAGIFFRVRYYGRSTKVGVGRRSTLYVWQGAHQMDDGRILFASNVGETAEEAIAALEAVELFNREAQTGAKLLFHAIATVPYQLVEMDGGIDRMFEIGQRFAEEQFGSRDLPFALALHPPSEEGDQRNWHIHLIFSSRPLVLTGDHEWDIGRMMRREIDNPEAFEEMRHLYARIQTEVVQEAGLNITYTALSNVERGLPNAPQKHLGSARTARVRRGEEDQVNESNWEKMLAGEAALLDEQLRHGQERAAAEQALLDSVQERVAGLIASVTNRPSLAIPALADHAEPIANLSLSAATLGVDKPADAPALVVPVANLQPGDRGIADVASLAYLPPSEHDRAPGTLISGSAVRSMARPIDVPRAVAGIVDRVVALASVPSLPTAFDTNYRIAAVPVTSAEGARAVLPSLPLGNISAIVGQAGAAIRKPPSIVEMGAATDGIGLSLGIGDGPAPRPLDLPKEAAALASSIIDRDLDDLDRLFAARRDRIAIDRAKAKRAEMEQAQQREREDTERQERETEQALLRQSEQAALDAMLATIEAERILITFEDDACVVDDAVRKRFGVTPARIAAAMTQERLDAIADRQRAEIEPMTVYAAANGDHIVHGDRGWTLSLDAPDHLRRVADAWVHEPILQRAFSEAIAIHREAHAKAQLTRRTEQSVTIALRPSRRELLILAAHQREAMTERWRQKRRFDQDQDTRGHDAEIGALRPSSPVPSQPLPAPLDPGQDR